MKAVCGATYKAEAIFIANQNHSIVQEKINHEQKENHTWEKKVTRLETTLGQENVDIKWFPQMHGGNTFMHIKLQIYWEVSQIVSDSKKEWNSVVWLALIFSDPAGSDTKVPSRLITLKNRVKFKYIIG